MSKPLTKNPTLLTVLLSAATVAGYVAYRFTLGGADSVVDPMAGMHADDNAGQDTASALAAQPSAAGPGLVDALPALPFDVLGGSGVTLDSYAGRPLLINFWATWCGPCLKEIPLLREFHTAQAGIDVIGIAVDDPADVASFAADTLEFNYPVLLGLTAGYEAMAVFRNDASAMPFSVFVDAEGAVLGKYYGELHDEELAAFAGTIEALGAGRIDRAAARERIATLQLH